MTTLLYIGIFLISWSDIYVFSDLKPENLLLDKDGHVLLTDFNVCSNLKESNPSSPSGTRPYMGKLFFCRFLILKKLAPEMFLGSPYSYSVDWWALGAILYECTFGRVSGVYYTELTET